MFIPEMNEVGRRGEELLHGQIDAVGGRPVHGEDAGPMSLDAEGMVKGRGQRGGALLPVGGDDDDPAEPRRPRD